MPCPPRPLSSPSLSLFSDDFAWCSHLPHRAPHFFPLAVPRWCTNATAPTLVQTVGPRSAAGLSLFVTSASATQPPTHPCRLPARLPARPLVPPTMLTVVRRPLPLLPPPLPPQPSPSRPRRSPPPPTQSPLCRWAPSPLREQPSFWRGGHGGDGWVAEGCERGGRCRTASGLPRVRSSHAAARLGRAPLAWVPPGRRPRDCPVYDRYPPPATRAHARTCAHARVAVGASGGVA